MGVGGQNHAPEALREVKTRSPLYRRLGAPQGVENFVHTEIRSSDRPVHIESLYRLSNLGPRQNKLVSKITSV